MQQLHETESKLRATVAEQAVAIQRHTSLTAHTDRHIHILTRLVSKLRSHRNLKAHELEHATVDSHVEALQEEKQGLQKTLEKTAAIQHLLEIKSETNGLRQDSRKCRRAHSDKSACNDQNATWSLTHAYLHAGVAPDATTLGSIKWNTAQTATP